jgi:hypothetical protein
MTTTNMRRLVAIPTTRSPSPPQSRPPFYVLVAESEWNKIKKPLEDLARASRDSHLRALRIDPYLRARSMLLNASQQQPYRGTPVTVYPRYMVWLEERSGLSQPHVYTSEQIESMRNRDFASQWSETPVFEIGSPAVVSPSSSSPEMVHH